MIRDVFAAAAAITTRRRRRRRSGIEHFDRSVGRARRHSPSVIIVLAIVNLIPVSGVELFLWWLILMGGRRILLLLLLRHHHRYSLSLSYRK